MPTLSELGYIHWSQQIRIFGQVRARIESELPRTAVLKREWVNILQLLAFDDINRSRSILETGAAFQPGNIAAEDGGSASLQTAHEHILVVTFIVARHNRILVLAPVPQVAQRINEMDRHSSLRPKTKNEDDAAEDTNRRTDRQLRQGRRVD